MKIIKQQFRTFFRPTVTYVAGGLSYLLCLYMAIALWWYRPGEIGFFEAMAVFCSPQSLQDYFIVGAVIILSIYGGAVLMILFSYTKGRPLVVRVITFSLLVLLAIWVHVWGVIYWKQTIAASIWLYMLVLPILCSGLLILLRLLDLFYPRARARKS